MLKIITFGSTHPDSHLNIIQRNGKRIVVAITLDIDVISERLDDDLNSEATVNFSITEIPVEVARKVIADTAEGQSAIVVLEYGKPVKEDVKERVAEFVGKCIRQVSLLLSEDK